MKIRVSKLDAEFALAIKERDGWKCRRCGRSKAQGWAIHAAHVFSRRIKATRWDAQNLFSLCFVCHRWAHDWPLEFHVWVRDQLGDAVYESLAERARRVNMRNPEGAG
jgi:5-methylcytosine-specific restriction endonuclease McrA